MQHSFISREAERLVDGQAVTDGAGVRLLRVLSADLQRRLDPFLMLDEFRSDNPGDYIAGFPSHPHRGFETVTYMLAGRMRHRDNAGNEGLLGPGGVQWMTAGRGIVHSELPEQEDGLMHGFQLWLNLPAKRKLCAPWYRDIPAAEIPSAPAQGPARLIAGNWRGQAGAVEREATEPLYLDLHLDADGEEALEIPSGHNAFLYVYQGEVAVGAQQRGVKARQMAVLDNRAGSDGVIVRAAADSRLLLIAGKPLGEPIAQWGPFVMNSREQVEEAIADFRDGRF
ncbi:redox-sensitive bicupin YhaK (pirin superfamily) [Chromobacterium alkanivorans]|uniref:pirin family protein n=1 Tax=Chromobacterium alkanivorans TaxID=1071719 RepID=UPI002167489B|nr:pirin family protein [Chromobacterium alkanivorans]MCS3804410.1 redox-sensitive bicupin YhaK (pirin superfamily) [Chromobacterium alkanivorans]MCS3818370.1 redox-sensitive bicupin YhaK (pirin superfamily) [Chromobacterium alkanivorans]MCS3873694.1 redox-sensitive bicupin YhaK (pirin superfamily) [Chromobacterium alkanivorans]